MRVLLSTMASLGHVNPCLAVATALRERGHEVRLASAPAMGPHVEAEGFTHVPFGVDHGCRPGRRLSRWDVPRRLEVDYYRSWMDRADDLRRHAVDWRADVLMHDWYEPAGLIVSDQLGLPTAVLGIMARPPQDRMEEASCLADYPTSDSTYGELLLNLYPPSLSFADTPRLEHEHYFRVPIPDKVHDAAAAYVAPHWLDDLGDRPLLYATMGFMYGGLPGFIEGVIEAASGLDAHVVMTVGGYADDLADLEPLPPNVHVEAYVPQSLLLPRCTAVICHGGFQILMTALSHGLPVGSIPVLWSPAGRSDAQRLHELGVGPIYPVDHPSETGTRALEPLATDRLRDMMDALLYDDSHRRVAEELRQEIEALPDVSDAVPLIESLIA